MKKINIEYLCSNLAGVSGLPVRYFKGERLVKLFSTVNLPKDPFNVIKQEVFRIQKAVGYYITKHDDYYGFVAYLNERIVIGPTRQIPYTQPELKDIAFENNVSGANVNDFICALKSINRLQLNSVIRILFIINNVLNKEELTMTDISVTDFKQDLLVKQLSREAANITVESIDGAEQKIHNSMDVERYMLTAVRNGDVALLKEFFAGIPSFNSGVIAQSGLRQAQNLFIVTATLVSRSAISGGMDAEEALSLSDRYIQKCEMLTSTESVTNLNYRLVMDYAERMAMLRPVKNPSKTVIEITNYIRHHLSEPVTVQALAKHLLKGRSRLSTDFKKETGENLSEFILKRKVEEGKRLLRFTEKSAADIAYYLGFSSHSHFSRTFKKYVGVSPNEYRLSDKI